MFQHTIQGETQSPAPGKEERLAVTQAGDWLVGDQLCGKGPGGLHG